MREFDNREPRDEIMDADNRAQTGGTFDHKLIEQVYEGMRVFDAAG
jgi:hypothetical protein